MDRTEGVSNVLILRGCFVIHVIFSVAADTISAQASQTVIYFNAAATISAKIGDWLRGMDGAVHFPDVLHLR